MIVTKKFERCLIRAFLMIAVVALSACAAPAPKPLYQWANYEPRLYEYFKAGGNNPGGQISVLEAQLQKNQAAGEASPPGLHGHLALLYSKMGDDLGARRHLEAERSLFPESAAYVDFLLKKPMPPSSAAPGAPASASLLPD